MYQLNHYPRESILSQYIQEKNQQLKAFLHKEKELQDSFFGQHPFAPGEFRRPLAAGASGVMPPTGISSELVHDITEIARFCTETKLQQDRQQDQVEKLGVIVNTQQVELARLINDLHDQRIQNDRCVNQITGLKAELARVTNIVKDLQSGSAVQPLATKPDSTIQIGLSKQIEAMYVIGDTEYVVQAVVPTTSDNHPQDKVVEPEISKSVPSADEESEISVFSY